MEMKDITSGKEWEAKAPFSQGKKICFHSLVFLSGQVSIDDHGNVVGKGDLTAQTRKVFDNIRDLLAVAGSTMSDIIKMTYYVTDMDEWEKVHAVRAEYFSDHMPASTTVQVSRLHKSEYLIEIEVVALGC